MELFDRLTCDVYASTIFGIDSEGFAPDITIVNNCHFELFIVENNPEKYRLKILDPQSLGINACDTKEEFLDLVIIALNFNLKNMSFSFDQFSSTEINEDNQWLLDDDSVNERDVIDILDLLIQLSRYTENDKEIHNLKKAFEEFQSSTVTFNEVGIFKHLFSSFELSLNNDGEEIRGSKFDKKAHKKTKISLETIKHWRHLYNGLKHPDRTNQEIEIINKSKEVISDHILQLKPVLNKLFLKQLRLKFKQNFKQNYNLSMSSLDILDHLKPMIHHEKLTEYEQKNTIPKFDVIFFQRHDYDTLFGSKKAGIENILLRDIAGQLLDYTEMYDYEIWMRLTSASLRKINQNDAFRYAISYQTWLLDEELQPLDLKFVNDWLVMAINHKSDNIEQKKYLFEFGYDEEVKEYQTNFLPKMKEIDDSWNTTEKRILDLPIKKIIENDHECPECKYWLAWYRDHLRFTDTPARRERWAEIKYDIKQLITNKKNMSEEEYEIKLNRLTGTRIAMENHAKEIDGYYEKIVSSNKPPFYECAKCSKILCGVHIKSRRVCNDCRININTEVEKEMGIEED